MTVSSFIVCSLPFFLLPLPLPLSLFPRSRLTSQYFALAINDSEDDTANCPLLNVLQSDDGSVKETRILPFVSFTGKHGSRIILRFRCTPSFSRLYPTDDFLVSDDTTTSRHSYEHAECLRHATGRSCRARRLAIPLFLSLSFSFSLAFSLSLFPSLAFYLFSPPLPFHPYSLQRT